MTKNEVDSILKRAKENFLKYHLHLLDVNSSERSITHQFASELIKDEELADWSIDCEYSRDAYKAKEIGIEIVSNQSDDLSPKIVYPDIIIHKRYKVRSPDTANNLIVIEAKKNNVDSAHDLRKLKGYITTLNYQFAVMLTFNCNEPWDITWKIWSHDERDNIS